MMQYDAILRNLIIFMGGLKLLVVTVVGKWNCVWE